MAPSPFGSAHSCSGTGDQAHDQSDHALAPNYAWANADGHHYAFAGVFPALSMTFFQHKRSRQLADYAKEAAGMNQEQLFQLLLQVRSSS